MGGDGVVATLKSAVATLAFISQELERKSASIQRLRRLLFGSSEKTRNVLGALAKPGKPAAEAPPPTPGGDANSPAKAQGLTGANGQQDAKANSKGHGRNGVAAYVGASKVHVAHPTLAAGHACPGCGDGKVHPMKQPAQLLRVRGMAPLQATVYACDRFRCGSCGRGGQLSAGVCVRHRGAA